MEPRARIFVKVYGYLPFSKNMGKTIDEKKRKNLSSK